MNRVDYVLWFFEHFLVIFEAFLAMSHLLSPSLSPWKWLWHHASGGSAHTPCDAVADKAVDTHLDHLLASCWQDHGNTTGQWLAMLQFTSHCWCYYLGLSNCACGTIFTILKYCVHMLWLDQNIAHAQYTSYGSWTKSLTAPSVLPRSGNSLLC